MKFIVYTIPGCPQCKVLKMKMNATGVEYECYEDQDKIEALGFKGAPVLIAGEEKFVGPAATKWFTQWAKENINGN